MAHPGCSEDVLQEGRTDNSASMETLRSYLKLAEKSVKRVRKMSSPKFNKKQCEHLALKLEEVVESARLSKRSFTSSEIGRGVEIFQSLLGLADEIETFIHGCCNKAWIHSAITNFAKDVSLVAFNLELLKMVFSEERMGRSLTVHQVEDIHDVAVQVVKDQAAIDMDYLFGEVTVALETLRGEEKELAGFLFKGLETIKSRSCPSESQSIHELNEMFKWVKLTKESLGKGSTGDVRRSMWLDTEVAVKTFYGDGVESIFIEEVGNIARLSHPNITSTFCINVGRHKCAIVMELMDQTLLDEIQQRWEDDGHLPYSIFEAVNLMLQIGEGVNYLHSHGVVHMDLKTSNILIKRMKLRNPKIEYVTVKVTDFGLRRTRDWSTSGLTYQTYSTGTQRWRAPEFLDLDLLETRRPFNPHKIDVYSFAMVCYEILSGKIPFEDIRSQRSLKKMVSEGVRPILPQHCPPALKTLIESCWVSDNSARPNFAHICKELRHLKDFSINQDDKLKTLLVEEINPTEANHLHPSTKDSVTFPETHINSKQVGKGISAIVYEVEWEGRKVAKKIYDGLDVPHFETEVQVLKGLEHPNIISLLQSGKEKANCYVLMDLMDADLHRYMRVIASNNTSNDSLPFTIPEAMHVMLQIAHGMRYLHENKIVHRDLKAGNILVKQVPRSESEIGLVAKVCDFGLAIIKNNTVTYSDLEPNAGTNRWIAPELIKFHANHSRKKGPLARLFARMNSMLFPSKQTMKLPFKSDVYSFAMVCYEILTGTVPFPTIGVANEVKRRVQKGERPELPSHCPPDLKVLIQRCWRHDPKERPKFGEICEELQHLKDSLPQI